MRMINIVGVNFVFVYVCVYELGSSPKKSHCIFLCIVVLSQLCNWWYLISRTLPRHFWQQTLYLPASGGRAIKILCLTLLFCLLSMTINHTKHRYSIHAHRRLNNWLSLENVYLILLFCRFHLTSQVDFLFCSSWASRHNGRVSKCFFFPFIMHIAVSHPFLWMFKFSELLLSFSFIIT